MRLFVYGTLKKGFRAHDILERQSAVFLKEARTIPQYQLYEINWFPGMVIDELTPGGVRGELYLVTQECLDRLDAYEGAPDLFRRHEVELDDGSTAISYLFNKEFVGKSRIEDGFWRNGKEENSET